MSSPYVTILADNIDFSPLQEKIFTIKNFKLNDVRATDNIQYFQAMINDYIVKVRFLNSNQTVEGACSCKDFTMKKKRDNLFCKHILYLIDQIYKTR